MGAETNYMDLHVFSSCDSVFFVFASASVVLFSAFDSAVSASRWGISSSAFCSNSLDFQCTSSSSAVSSCRSDIGLGIVSFAAAASSLSSVTSNIVVFSLVV